jgi:uncharacterized membrane protein YkvA (DUF1232 family)
MLALYIGEEVLMATVGKGDESAKRTRDSGSYTKAKSKAEEYVRSPEKLSKLVDEAAEKANSRQSPLKELWGSLNACFRMLRAYASGSYREIPWQSLVMIVASVVYFVMPIDLIPDFIVGLGLADDAALLGWTIKTFASDIQAFQAWEAKDAKPAAEVEPA